MAVVAQAVWGTARALCPDRPRVTLVVLSAGAVLFWPSAWGQVAVIRVTAALAAHQARAGRVG